MTLQQQAHNVFLNNPPQPPLTLHYHSWRASSIDPICTNINDLEIHYPLPRDFQNGQRITPRLADEVRRDYLRGQVDRQKYGDPGDHVDIPSRITHPLAYLSGRADMFDERVHQSTAGRTLAPLYHRLKEVVKYRATQDQYMRLGVW